MTKPVSVLYRTPPQNIEELIRADIKEGLQLSSSHSLIFFRADDIGIPSKNFKKLIQCFQKHKIPLCLATVPSWLTQERLSELYSLTGKASSQWCWHQHGATHRNYEATGKKQEFGPSRSKKQLQLSLKNGRDRLRSLLKDDFFTVFTPPWNRCSMDTLESLRDLNFIGISRSQGALPKSLSALPDFAVNVDLHTRKEISCDLALSHLRKEFVKSISSGLCGVMIHHQRMNDQAFHFLDLLLKLIKTENNISPVHFRDLLL